MGAALAALMLSACGGDDDAAQADDVPERTTTTAVEPDPTTTTTALTAPPAAGTPQPDDGATLNAIEFAQPVATDAPAPAEAGYPDGYEWAGVHAELCLDPSIGEAIVTRNPWRLAYADGALIEPSSTGYRGFPQPEYPWGDTAIAAGQCVRGWIVYAAPPGVRPATVQYARPGTANVIEWRIG